MNRTALLLIALLLCRGPLFAQDAALVERVNKLSSYVDELMADKARQQKQIADLTREVNELREQLNRASGSASQESVSTLADAVKELERKHQRDMESVATEIEKLGKTAASRASSVARASSAAEQGYEYVIQAGDTLSTIVQAYRTELKLKTTVDDVLKANPGLKPTAMQVGQKIFIPAK